MAERIKPRLMKGLRDFMPSDMIKRNYVLNIIKKIFTGHGFLPLETPAVEYWEILSGKYGEEGEKLIYRFSDRGERDLGLRYDLTVPLCRVIAMHQNDIVKPFKRFQIQPVWRADKPGKGRYREFYQCDFDVAGTKDLLADTEVIQIAFEILEALGFHGYLIKLNSRKVLAGMIELSGAEASMEADICRAIDKLDKIGISGVEEELLQRGISTEAKNKIINFMKIKGSIEEVLEETRKLFKDSKKAVQGLDEISTIKENLSYMGVSLDRVEFDLSLARGLDYYTGPIFETVVCEPKIGSLSGGGRFDGLIGQYTGMDIPAVGNSIGLERIITVMDELDMYPKSLNYGIDVLISRFKQDSPAYPLQTASKLRSAGINAEVYMGKAGLRGQLGYAEDKKIPLVIIAGEDERAKGEVTLRDMNNHEQICVQEDILIQKVQEILG